MPNFSAGANPCPVNSADFSQLSQFVTYARKFIGPWAGFASGWLYWLNWAMTGIAEITAVAIYVHKWLPDVPQWTQ